MIEKIEWYREVLELEPGSKVFLPLARLLCDSNPDEAIRILRFGIEKHPEYIEAKLLLIDLLSSSGRDNEYSLDVSDVSDLLFKYPSFLEAWGEQCNNTNISLIIKLLAASIKNPELDLQQIILAGLTQSSSKEKNKQVQGDLTVMNVQTDFEPILDTDVYDIEPEIVTVKTRSMAEILLEQGDVDGAIEIYEEIYNNTDDEAKRESLKEIIDDLKTSTQTDKALVIEELQIVEKNEAIEELEAVEEQVATEELQEEQAVLKEQDDNSTASKKLAMLENLAKRLDDRAEKK